MSTSTSIAISSAQSSAAMAEAAHAKRIACEGVLNSFDAKGATVEAMRVYADCVNRLHPEDLTPDQAGMLKIVLTLCFVGAAIGAYKGYEEDGIPFSVLGFVMGFVVTGVAIGIIYLFMAAAAYVLGIG